MGVLKLKKALLVVDVQNDFCPKGALGIHEGDKVVSVLNAYMKFFAKKQLPIFVTRDWHPKVTKHFKKFGGIWPVHCVAGTKGAEFNRDLRVPQEAIVMSKGMDPEKDSYSAFHATDVNGTELANLLKIFGVTEIYIGGLATDYCVKYSSLDALNKGLKVFILSDAVKGVNLKAGDSEAALKELIAGGARLVTLDKIEDKKTKTSASRR